jgi:hypothetical protein
MAAPNVSCPLFDLSNAFEEYSMESMDTPVLSSYSKPLASDFSGASPRTPNASFGGGDFKTKQLMEPQLEALCISATMEHIAPLDPYITSYWESCNTFFPIIHRGTFDPTENGLLSSAMAALGTQYHNTAAARQKGVELNDYCRKSIDLVSFLVLVLGVSVLTTHSVPGLGYPYNASDNTHRGLYTLPW